MTEPKIEISADCVRVLVGNLTMEFEEQWSELRYALAVHNTAERTKEKTEMPTLMAEETKAKTEFIAVPVEILRGLLEAAEESDDPDGAVEALESILDRHDATLNPLSLSLRVIGQAGGSNYYDFHVVDCDSKTVAEVENEKLAKLFAAAPKLADKLEDLATDATLCCSPRHLLKVGEEAMLLLKSIGWVK